MGSIYEKDSYSQSKIVFLAGPIECWWDTEEEPNKFESLPARGYRMYRQIVEDTLKQRGYLVYKPHTAFTGDWNERAQAVNDMAIEIADVLINMTPPGVKALGTNHEVHHAETLGVRVIDGPPPVEFPFLLTSMGKQARLVADAVDSALAI